MNKLEYCVSLREKGLGANAIKEKMKAEGFEASEIPHYLKKSDEIFLDQLIQKHKKPKKKGKTNRGINMLLLGLSLALLVSAFLGYTKIGLIGLFVIWSLVGISSYR